MRTYRVNRPTTGKGRSAGSNARVVCSTLLCAMPIRQGFPLCQSAPSALALSAHRLHARPPLLYMRAWNRRIRESARFFRVMCSHAWYRESCVGETDLTFLLCPPPALTCHAILPATRSRMRKEFKRGKPSSFCPFRTFRTSEKYMVLYVLLHDQKYQKSSKTFPLRNFPVLSRFAKARSAPLLCQRTDFMHARHSLYMRAWNQRIRESARLFRGMCSHAWYG